MKFDTELWFEGQSEVKFVASTKLPTDIPVSAVKIFSMVTDEILLVEVPEKGGWDIPGGHVEDGEGPVDAAIREVQEETNGQVRDLSLFGYLIFKRVIETEENKDYPLKSLIAMYTGDIFDVATDNETLNFEATKLAFFPVSDVASLSPFWTELSGQILDYARTVSL